MSEPTNQDLKELILSLEKNILGLDKKMATGFIELKGEIKQVEERLNGEIKRVEEKLNGIDKRLSNEKVISRSTFIAVMVGAITGMVKYLFFVSPS